jgi:hypothetical protein
MMGAMIRNFSRFRFDRLRHFIKVLLQQGRVQLDSDWNEPPDPSGRAAGEQDREERSPEK